MLRVTPKGEDGTRDLYRQAGDASLPADIVRDRGEEARPPDYLHLITVAENQAASYVAQINRKFWTRAYRAFHNQHFVGSKYDHRDYARRSKFFVPKTRSAIRK